MFPDQGKYSIFIDLTTDFMSVFALKWKAIFHIK